MAAARGSWFAFPATKLSNRKSAIRLDRAVIFGRCTMGCVFDAGLESKIGASLLSWLVASLALLSVGDAVRLELVSSVNVNLNGAVK